MLGTIIQVVVVLAIVGAVVAVVFVVSFRTKFAPVQNLIRRTNRRFTNPRMLNRDAGQPGAYASVVNHTGRRSGTHYRTPVVVAQAGDDAYVVALPYGAGVDWVRNVLAAGSATIDHEGRRIAVDRPSLIGQDEGNRHFPLKDQRTHRRFGVTDFLLLRHGGGLGAAPEGPRPSAVRHHRVSASGDVSDIIIAERDAKR